MSKKNEMLRKKLVRLGISVVVLAIMLAVFGLVPAFQSAKYEICDNQLVVERENMYNTNMGVIVNIIDGRGNVTRETVKVYFEGDETNYTFDQEYFKDILDTEDDVYVIEAEDGLFTTFSNYTTFVSVLMVILFIIAMIACFSLMMSIFDFIH